MATVNPGYALGRHVSVMITPLTKATDGTFENHALGTLPFAGRVENHNFGLSLTTENISPIGSFNANPVPYEQSTEFQLTEDAFARPDLTSSAKGVLNGNVLKTVAKATFYVRLRLMLIDDAGAEIESIYAVCLMTAPFALNTTKSKVQWSATLQTIAIFDSASGAELPNPQFVASGGTPSI